MKCLLVTFAAVAAFASLFNYASGAPIPASDVNVLNQSPEDNKLALKFLKVYEYLDETTRENGSSAYNGALAKAVSDVQRMGDLPVTGQLNKETMALIKTPRCGSVDPVRKLNETNDSFGRPKIGRYYLQGTFWKKKDLTYRFKASTQDLSQDAQKDIIRRMIDKWDQASTLTITEADPALRDDDVDILISFVRRYHSDPYPFDGQGGTLAHAYYPHNNKGLSGDAHFDDDERFTTGTPNGINLDWVALHEIGHSLGLEHSNVREAVMYPWYKGYFPNIELTRDDILGIQQIYGRPPKPKPSPSTTVKPTSKETKPPTPTDPNTPSTKPTPSPTPTDPDTSEPDVCSVTKYDAVAVEHDARGAKLTHFFSGDYFWTHTGSRLVKPTKAQRVKAVWPEVLTPVDAVHREKLSEHLVFFQGNKFWKYNKKRQLQSAGYVTQYFNTRQTVNMNAMFVLAQNGKTYVFSGSQYWRLNINTNKFYEGYPRSIRPAWGNNFPIDIDAAVTWPSNSRSYVFKGGQYWRLHKWNIEAKYPQNIAEKWMKCNTNVGGFSIGSIQESP